MAEEICGINEWNYKNLDLIEECFEHYKKACVLIAGASSSGKSFIGEELKGFLEGRGYKCCVLSTDSYNKGISGIIADKVNANYFNSALPNMPKIRQKIKDVIITADFEDKFSPENLEKIRPQLEGLLPGNQADEFVSLLPLEYKVINFDEDSVYDLKSVRADILALLNGEKIIKKEYSKIISEQCGDGSFIDGNDYNVIIVDGLYAINDDIVQNLAGAQIISNFVESDNKTLFLRRILRDAKTTSANSLFTVPLYFGAVMNGYKSTVLPSKKNADIVLNNSITFDELRHGELFSNKLKLKIDDKAFVDFLFNMAQSTSYIYQRDLYFSDDSENDEHSNLLRVRSVSQDGKNFTLSSLVHKGAQKLRRDGKVLRPINILVKDGDLNKIYGSEQELVKAFSNANLKVSRTIVKKRTRIVINGEKFTIDQFDNSAYVEVNPECDSAICKFLLKNGKVCNTFYEIAVNNLHS